MGISSDPVTLRTEADVVRLREAMGKPGKGIVAIIANALECNPYWRSTMVDYIEHLGGLQQYGSKVGLYIKQVQQAALDEQGLSELTIVVSELHLCKEALRSGACTALEQDCLNKVREFSALCRLDCKHDMAIISGLQKVLSEATILWPEDVQLAEALQTLGNIIQKRSFDDIVDKLEQAANDCWDAHITDPYRRRRLLNAGQGCSLLLRSPAWIQHLQGPMQSGKTQSGS